MSCFWPPGNEREREKQKQTWRRRAGATSLMWTSQPCNVPLFLCNNCWSALELNTDPITLHTASSLSSQQCSAVVNPGRVWVGEFAQTRPCFRSRTNASSTAFSLEQNLRHTRCSLLFFSFFLSFFFLTSLGYTDTLYGSWQSLRAVADP